MKYYTILFLLFYSCYVLANDISNNQLKGETQVSNELVSETNISLKTIDLYKAKIDSISEASKQTAINTEPTPLSSTDWDEYLNITLALIGALATFLAVWSIRLDTKQNSINKVMQEELLKDLIRHFYRNMVVLSAIKLKLKDKYDSFYPSEEHILKFKVLPEDVKIDRFTSSPEHYQQLHKFELQLRNFDIEVDVTIDHLKNKEIPEEVKIRDLDNLAFKCGHLSNFVLNMLINLKFHFNSIQKVNDFLSNIYLDNVEEKRKNNVDIEEQIHEKSKELTGMGIDITWLQEMGLHKFYMALSEEVQNNLRKDTLLEYERVNVIGH